MLESQSKTLCTFTKVNLIHYIIKSQFSYWPLIWMFCSRNSNNLINSIYERSLRIVTNDKNSNFEDLLKSNNQTTVHQRNLKALMTKIFKIINGFSPSIMDDFFMFHKNTFNIRSFQIISNENKKTVRY